jgi:HTH-type transcriptional regulator/antitoxin HigA
VEKMSVITQDILIHWQAISPILTIHDEVEYDRAVKRLDELLDEVGTDEGHPLYELLDTLGTIISAYEETHHEIPAANGADVLRYLLEEHGLRQAEFPEIGSQGVVSEILNGKRTLNMRQVQALSQRFGVSPAVFF